MATGSKIDPVEIGVFEPGMKPVPYLEAGDVGYIATGLKTVSECRVGDTITHAAKPAGGEPLPGYQKPNRWSLPAFIQPKARIMEVSRTRLKSCSLTTPR